MLRYPCLVLDHDDTVVNSTASVHYPCFQAYLDRYRPGRTVSLEQYFVDNFFLGFERMCLEKYDFTEAELEREFLFWQQYVARHDPRAYDGIAPLLRRYRAAGGHICVVSHSVADSILRDYRRNDLPQPELVFGWELPPQQRKPNPYPLLQIMERFLLAPEQILVVDDLKPGFDMARSCGAHFAAAGWGNPSAEIADFMQRHSVYYLPRVADLERLLFSV